MSAATTTSSLLLAGRILIALLFAVFGYMKLANAGATTAAFAQLGLPIPHLAVALALSIELGCAALLIVGWKTREAAWLLAAFTLAATLIAHRFWLADAAQAFNETEHFYKNLSIVGGLVALAVAGPGCYSIDRA
jgi:putative oxidoreductase